MPWNHEIMNHLNLSRGETWTLRPCHLASRPSFRCTSTQAPSPSNVPLPSLESLCLASLSINAHLLTPFLLTSLPPHLAQRVISRISSDRGYNIHSLLHSFPSPTFKSQLVTSKHDEATLWSLLLLSTPLHPIPNITLLLSPTSLKLLLNQLEPRSFTHSDPAIHPSRWDKNPEVEVDWQHPLITLPRLYSSLSSVNSFHFLTALVLSTTPNANGTAASSFPNRVVDDTSIQYLRYCTHLTVLWTVNCPITDAGIRLLSASLSPPSSNHDDSHPISDPIKDKPKSIQAKGLWRLRAWYLTNCRSISDLSLRVFSKWPGLVLLDLRGTSCTEYALGILNRSNREMGDKAVARIKDAGLPKNDKWKSVTPDQVDLFKPLISVNSVTDTISHLYQTLLTDLHASSIDTSSTTTPSTFVENTEQMPYFTLVIAPDWLPQKEEMDDKTDELGKGSSSISSRAETEPHFGTSPDAKSQIIRPITLQNKNRSSSSSSVSNDAHLLTKGEMRLMLVRCVDAGWDQNFKSFIANEGTDTNSSQPKSFAGKSKSMKHGRVGVGGIVDEAVRISKRSKKDDLRTLLNIHSTSCPTTGTSETISTPLNKHLFRPRQSTSKAEIHPLAPP